MNSQRLTWNGPFTVGANNSFTITFGVRMDPQLPGGDYAMTASAVTDDTYSGRATLAIRKMTPLIFVPGIMGSTLSCGGDNWWPTDAADKTGHWFGKLALTNHGATESNCKTDLTTGDIVRSAFGIFSFYGKTISELEASGYVEGQSLFVYPYDWRKSVESAAAGLLAKIDEVRAETGAAKVDILAHSQGGLVTRAALASSASVSRVRRVLTMATPFTGPRRRSRYCSPAVRAPSTGSTSTSSRTARSTASRSHRSSARSPVRRSFCRAPRTTAPSLRRYWWTAGRSRRISTRPSSSRSPIRSSSTEPSSTTLRTTRAGRPIPASSGPGRRIWKADAGRDGDHDRPDARMGELLVSGG